MLYAQRAKNMRSDVADSAGDSGSGDDVDTDAVGVHGTFLNLGGWRQQVRQLLAETEAE